VAAKKVAKKKFVSKKKRRKSTNKAKAASQQYAEFIEDMLNGDINPTDLFPSLDSEGNLVLTYT